METRLRHLAAVPVRSGLPDGVRDPVRPEWFAGRHEAQLGTAVGLAQFGVNHVVLEPGARSSLRHWHAGEDEFVYVLSGALTLIDGNGEHAMTPGSVAGFVAGEPNAHHLANRSAAPASFLVVGTRKPGVETIHYPDDFAQPRTVRRDTAGRREA
ncbi:MAG TPA: cupin domain-containing protein [Rhizomicrobium sp.]|jgi:uncharacterized cupin superfamily protein|nr:cupin domain-containing protein [Rhizomicrobium sp.]